MTVPPPRKYDQPRPDVPAGLRRSVEVESGHACTVRHCGEHTYLEVHHINGDREDNQLGNVVLLCDKHHKMAHAGVIDRKALIEYKRFLQRWARDMPGLVQATSAERLPEQADVGHHLHDPAALLLVAASISGLFVLVAASRSAAQGCGFHLASLAKRVPVIDAQYAQGFLLGLCCGGFLFPVYHRGVLTVSQLDSNLAERACLTLADRIAAVEDESFREKLEFLLRELHAFFDAP